MKTKIALLGITLIAFFAMIDTAHATPSTQIWIPSTDIQGFKSLHLGVDNYNTVGKKSADGGHAFPTNYGLTVGVIPSETIGVEVGIDIREASDDPNYFNAKIGIDEGKLFDSSPALAFGGYEFGTNSNANDYNILYGLAAKTFEDFGRISFGYYSGNDKLLLDKNGKKDASGLLASWDRSLGDKFWVAIDYMGGKNAYGATSFGVSYALSDKSSFIVGYDIFTEKDLDNDGVNDNADTMTFQLDVDLF